MDSKKSRYKGKIILAPMVRVGTLPFRLLAIDYGADLVYTEELIDYKLLKCDRVVNDMLSTVDYVDSTDGTVVFRTCDKEKSQLVLQLGTCDTNRAIGVGKLMENDISGIDINMGCPKEFSIKGGMGASLMENSEKAVEILRGLVENVSIPVTCKIRVFDDINKTIELCKLLESTGISAIGIHGRTKKERPQHQNRNDYIGKIAKELSIPVIANGGSKEINNYCDIETFRKLTNSSSVMLARAAQWNCSIFRPEGKLPIDDVITEYLKYSVIYDNTAANTKYGVQHMLRSLQSTTERGKKFLESQNIDQFCELWNLSDFFKGKRRVILEEEKIIKRQKLSNDNVISYSCMFLRKAFQDDKNLPKQMLLLWARRQGMRQPVYTTVQDNKLFQSVCYLNGKKYTSNYWEKNKKWAEQSSAIVALLSLQLIDKQILIETGCLL